MVSIPKADSPAEGFYLMEKGMIILCHWDHWEELPPKPHNIAFVHDTSSRQILGMIFLRLWGPGTFITGEVGAHTHSCVSSCYFCLEDFTFTR